MLISHHTGGVSMFIARFWVSREPLQERAPPHIMSCCLNLITCLLGKGKQGVWGLRVHSWLSQRTPVSLGDCREGSAAEHQKAQLKLSFICILLPTIHPGQFCHFKKNITSLWGGRWHKNKLFWLCGKGGDSNLDGSIQKRQVTLTKSWFYRISNWKEMSWLQVIIVFERLKGNNACVYGEHFKVREVIILLLLVCNGVGNISLVATPKL